jgi:lipase ATG15
MGRSDTDNSKYSEVARRGGALTPVRRSLRRLRAFAFRRYLQVRQQVTALVALIHVTLRSLYFPDEVSLYLDTFVRLVFSVYYIPFLAMVLALTHAAIERIVWVLVIPVTQEMERRPFSTSSVWTFVSGLSSIASRMLPFATLAVAVATVGHKLVNCVAEAMVDAYTTQRDIDYPLLRARIRFTSAKPTRMTICAVVTTVLAVGLRLLFHTNAFVEWSSRQPWVITASWMVLVVQSIFVLTTVLREAPLEGTSLSHSNVFTPSKWRIHALLSPLRTPGSSHDEQSAASTLSVSSPLPFVEPASSTVSNSRESSVSTAPLTAPGDGHHHSNSCVIIGLSSEVARPATADAPLLASSLTVTTPFPSPLTSTESDAPRHEGGDHVDESITPLTDATRSRTRKMMNASMSLALVSYVEDDWWRHHVYTMRYIAFFMVVMFTIAFAVARGPVFGLMSGVMILCYLNLPYLFAYTALSVSGAITRTLRSFSWLLRHLDASFPCLVIVIPYQVLLVSAIVFYRHHVQLCMMLFGVNMLLVARAIDLVREFDVTVHGSVLWRYAGSGALLPPSLAIVLEDGHEKKYQSPDVVTLDMTIDMQRMTIVYADGAEVQLKRQVVFPPGALRRYLFDHRFYGYTLPRLLALQSPGYFSGSKFRAMRVVLRFISMSLLLLYGLLVSGLIVQAAFPQLRPLPVRVTAAANNSHLTFDHIVLRMHLLSQEASHSAAEKNTSNSALEGYLSGLPEAASSAFRWNNITSATNEDFYPQLCKREYYNTSVWEIALLAVAPYLFNVEEFNSMLRFLNVHLGSDWVIQPRHGASCVPGDSNHRPTRWTDFYEVYSKQRDTAIISVRGTDMFSFTDFLFNINIFFEVALYQLMTTFIPGCSLMPKDLVVDLLRIASLPAEASGDVHETWAELTSGGNHSLRDCQQNNYGRDFFANLYNHIAYIGSRPSHPRHILLTGHSLGGAVASIVASQMGVKAVAFSAPGVMLARRKFDFSLRSLHQNVMTVISSNDIVPAIGEHGGELHHVECLAATRELCHAMEFMIGSLWRSCSSIRAKFPSIKDVI